MRLYYVVIIYVFTFPNLHRWLREVVEKGQFSWYFQGYNLIPECEEPRLLKHKAWTSVAEPSDFGCPPTLLHPDLDGEEIAVALGMSAYNSGGGV